MIGEKIVRKAQTLGQKLRHKARTLGEKSRIGLRKGENTLRRFGEIHNNITRRSGNAVKRIEGGLRKADNTITRINKYIPENPISSLAELGVKGAHQGTKLVRHGIEAERDLVGKGVKGAEKAIRASRNLLEKSNGRKQLENQQNEMNNESAFV